MGHEVWTLKDVIGAIPEQETYWLSNCSCRESSGSTCVKGLRTCLGFYPDSTSTEHGLGPVTRREVDALLAFAQQKRLIPRPFVDDEEMSAGIGQGDDGGLLVPPDALAGSCFCCDCCCGYLHGDAQNVPGPRIEATDRDTCTHCGTCVDACHFGARNLDDGTLTVNREKCFGCGLCADDCAAGAIRMLRRASYRAR
jgi:ferredoxin